MYSPTAQTLLDSGYLLFSSNFLVQSKKRKKKAKEKKREKLSPELTRALIRYRE